MFITERIISIDVAVTNLSHAVGQIDKWVQQASSRYICVSNVHMCMEAYDDDEFKNIVNSSDLVVPDGKPLVWAQKLLGNKNAEQVRGLNLMQSLCDLARRKQYKVGVYGGVDEAVLLQVENNLKLLYPGINISYTYSPPFRTLTKSEDLSVISLLDEKEVDILFVGVGCPKQERWMAEHKDSINCVSIGVGAAFDFISGSKIHAPIWVQNIGFEWLFRLFCEPRRLWKRYLKHNPRFVLYFIFQLLGKNFD